MCVFFLQSPMGRLVNDCDRSILGSRIKCMRDLLTYSGRKEGKRGLELSPRAALIEVIGISSRIMRRTVVELGVPSSQVLGFCGSAVLILTDLFPAMTKKRKDEGLFVNY
jgi:hypothetical protein